MSEIVCKKCGSKGNSKCPNCRSIFPYNFNETAVGNLAKFEAVEGEEGTWKFTMTVHVFSKEKPLQKLEKYLKDLTGLVEGKDFSLERALCRHSWRFAKGAKSEIGCGCG